MSIMTQHEIAELAEWCVAHLRVDYVPSGHWTTMLIGGSRIMSAYINSVTNEPEDYMMAHTDTAEQVKAMYNTWKDYA
jgi:hypothetical protein